MKVLVTGASGYLGSHIIDALVRDGHVVRAFVRSEEKLHRAVLPFRSPDVEVATGDITDEVAVRGAIEGCEAVIHAANVYTLDPRRSAEMDDVNVRGTDNVLSASVEAGCEPVVHISTCAALLPAPDPVPEDPPLGPSTGRPYSDSKKAADVIARRLQDEGAPVITTYPGVVMGPHDPGPGEMIPILRTSLVPTAPFGISGAGYAIADVSWVARLHSELTTRGSVPRHVTCSGNFVSLHDLNTLLARLTGRRLPQPFQVPRRVVAGVGSMMDMLQRIVPWRLPFNMEGIWVTLNFVPFRDTRARELVGPPPRLEETLTSAIRWAVDAGHLTSRLAGDLMTASGE